VVGEEQEIEAGWLALREHHSIHRSFQPKISGPIFAIQYPPSHSSHARPLPVSWTFVRMDHIRLSTLNLPPQPYYIRTCQMPLLTSCRFDRPGARGSALFNPSHWSPTPRPSAHYNFKNMNILPSDPVAITYTGFPCPLALSCSPRDKVDAS